MCGIIGSITKLKNENLFSIASELQNHRGPDSSGSYYFNTDNFNISLGHQRLAIIDLSSDSNQPMISKSKNSVLIFNGEIYNYLEIRDLLEKEGEEFESSGDTEILLKALDTWGIDKTLKKLNGMWAFAWLNKKQNTIYLSRDRFGEKPLYYSQSNGEIIFASEIKTLLSLAKIKFHLDFHTIKKYLEFGIMNDNENTFFKDIKQIKPSTYSRLIFKDKDINIKEKNYWKYDVDKKTNLNFESHTDELREVFRESVKIRLRSDVPVGILLSGGIDSSSIAAIAKKINSNQINLLSGVSEESEFDETKYIDIMQKHLDWPIHKVKLDDNPKNLFEKLKIATWYADTPLSSLSNLAHFLLMAKAKENNIKVILSGQGADELLCGYFKYLPFYMQEKIKKLDIIGSLKLISGFIGTKTFLNQFTIADAKRYMPNYFKFRRSSTFGKSINSEKSINIGMGFNSSVAERQIEDLNKFSVPTLNHFEDRMSMAHAREIRLPFLDHNLVELIMSSPTDFKLHNGWTKYCFRKAMEKDLPSEILWRKDKQGFINPQGEWLKHQLKNEIISNYFSEESHIFKLEIFDRKKLLDTYAQYCKQKINRGHISFKEIFFPLATEIWLRVFSKSIIGI